MMSEFNSQNISQNSVQKYGKMKNDIHKFCSFKQIGESYPRQNTQDIFDCLENNSSVYSKYNSHQHKSYKYYKDSGDYTNYKSANKTQQYYLQMSKKIADQSHVECAKHSAILVYNNEIIGVGVNKYILSKFNSRHSHLYFTNNKEYKNKYKINSNFDSFTIHAEIDVFINVYQKIPKSILKTLPLSLYVVRSQDNCLSLSKPCDKCQKFLKQFKNLKIFFSM